MLRRVVVPLLLVFLAAVTIGSPEEVSARSPVPWATGSTCNPATGTDAQRIKFDRWGAQNVATSGDSARIICGAQARLGRNTAVKVHVYDRNPDKGVCCKAVISDFDGDPLSVISSCTIGQSAAHKVLDLNFPDMDSPVISLDCGIPPATASGISHVTHYYVM